MKLRQKSYLLTVLLITLVLHASVLFVLLPNIRMTVSSAEARALGEEKALALAADRLFEDVAAEDRPIYARAFSIYDSGGATFAIGSGDARISLPISAMTGTNEFWRTVTGLRNGTKYSSTGVSSRLMNGSPTDSA